MVSRVCVLHTEKFEFVKTLRRKPVFSIEWHQDLHGPKMFEDVTGSQEELPGIAKKAIRFLSLLLFDVQEHTIFTNRFLFFKPNVPWWCRVSFTTVGTPSWQKQLPLPVWSRRLKFLSNKMTWSVSPSSPQLWPKYSLIILTPAVVGEVSSLPESCSSGSVFTS